MAPSRPVRIVGCNDPGPSDPVRIVNWEDVAQLDNFEDTDALFRGLSNNTVEAPFNLSYSLALVGGVQRVIINWDANRVIINDVIYPFAAGSMTLNTADVVNPTTYYIYARIINNAAVAVLSTVDPDTDPAVNYSYAWISIARIKSNGGTAIVYYVRNAFTQLDLLLHFIGEWDLYKQPLWVNGGGITINATTGVVDMAELEYRRMRFDRAIGAITAGSILLEDESIAYANLELITSYSDGSPVTAGKYHKLLLAVVTSLAPTYDFIIARQGKPTVEYATLADALTDAYNVAATSFPLPYRGVVFPLAYIVMKLGDASDLTTVDLRSTGITGSGGGGGSPIADHSLLINLGADDHPQYLRADGTRALTGNMAVDPAITIDGVDISAHAANVNAHHDAITLNAAADTLLGLSTQQITLDTQAANTVLAGPTSGAAAAPTFRALTGNDLAKAYGTIYVANGVAVQALTATVETKLTLFATNGISLNTTPDHTNDQITVANAGDYYISGHFSTKTSVNNTVFQFHAAVAGVTTYLGTHRKNSVAGDEGSCSFAGCITLGAGAVVSVNVTSDKTTNLTLIDGQLNVMRLA